MCASCLRNLAIFIIHYYIPSALRASPPTFPQHLHSLACSYLLIHICTVHTCFCMSAARRAAITERFRLRRNLPSCLSRKRGSWAHRVRLRFPFPLACRGKGNHGNVGMRLRFLFPLPVEETVIMGLWHALAIPFSPCQSRKRVR